MARNRDYPGQWSAIEWRLVCSKRDDDDKPCFGRPVPGDHRCARHYGQVNGRMFRRRNAYVERLVGKGPCDVKGISKQAEEDIFLGAPIDKDPGVALLEEVARTAGHVRWLEAKVRSLREAEMVWTKTLEADEDGTVGEGVPLSKKTIEYRNEINKWYEIYREERKHLAQVSVAALKAGVEERRVRLAERGVDALEAAITLALKDLGVDPYSERARQAIGMRLQEALGGPEDLFGYGKAPEALETAHRASQPEILDVEEVDF